MSFFTGKPGAFKRLEGVPNDTLSTAANYYKGLLGNDNEDFNSFAAPELRRFKQQTIPDLAEQFAGAGGGQGSLSSSGFQNSAATAATDLSERLGELRARLRQNAAQGLTDIGNMGTYYEQGQGGALDTIGPAIGSVVSEYGPEIGGAVGSLFGPAGTVVGAGIGKGASAAAKGYLKNRQDQMSRPQTQAVDPRSFR